MREKKVIIEHEHGIHLRPAMRIVDAANKFKCDIKISSKVMSADAKSMVQVTMIAGLKGTEIIVSADGKDEDEAIDVIAELVKNEVEAITKSK